MRGNVSYKPSGNHAKQQSVVERGRSLQLLFALWLSQFLFWIFILKLDPASF